MRLLKSKLKTVAWVALAILALYFAWTFNPAAERIRERFPTAKIFDRSDDVFLPFSLHGVWISPTDLDEGTYLRVDLEDLKEPVDFFPISRIAGLPDGPNTMQGG